MTTSDISVVMGTYNGERFVERQLRSILDQTLPPAEIVIGDDGSTDRTVQVVESVAAEAAVPIRVQRNAERLGFADNFLAGCRRAASPYVAFSDQDDLWAPEKLATGREALRRAAAALCVHAVEMIDSRDAVLGDNRRETGPTRVLPPGVAGPLDNFYGFTMLFERALLERIPDTARGLDPHTLDAALSHDRWVFLLASTFGRTVILNDALAGYRQHDAQLYGGTKDRTRTERIATKLARGGEQASYLAAFAAHQADLLESLAPPQPAAAWRAGAQRWRGFESHFRARARLHADMAAPRRFVALADAVRQGTYRSAQGGGLGPKRFVEDLTVTALRTRRSRTPLRRRAHTSRRGQRHQAR